MENQLVEGRGKKKKKKKKNTTVRKITFAKLVSSRRWRLLG